jgi:hypothetical protein
MEEIIETRIVTAHCFRGRDPRIGNQYMKWLISKGMPSDTNRFVAVIEPQEVGRRFGQEYRDYFIEYLGIPESECPIQTDKWLVNADKPEEKIVVWSRIVHWSVAKACFTALYLADEKRWQMDISQIDADPPKNRVEVVTKLACGITLDLAQNEDVRVSGYQYPDEKFLEEARPYLERMARQKHRTGKKGKRRGNPEELSLEMLARMMMRGKGTFYDMDKEHPGFITDLRKIYKDERESARKEESEVLKRLKGFSGTLKDS